MNRNATWISGILNWQSRAFHAARGSGRRSGTACTPAAPGGAAGVWGIPDRARRAGTRFLVRGFVFVALIGGLAATNARPEAPSPPPPVANATNRFAITGFRCEGCARGLASELRRTPGVETVNVSFTRRLAVVAFDTNRTATPRLVRAIEEAGYKARRLKR